METHVTEDEQSSGELSGHGWLQAWENELGPYATVSLEHPNELRSLVEDKELASRAVAFVVNSTRKGIVPLCADVASLLRAKRSLEKKICMLKKENEILRSSSSLSQASSHSISPSPNSQSSDKSNHPEYTPFTLQDRPRPCSRCSPCSSTLSNSPKFEKPPRQRLSSLQYSPASSQDDSRTRRHSPPRTKRSKTKHHKDQNTQLTHAVIHVNPSDDVNQKCPDITSPCNVTDSELDSIYDKDTRLDNKKGDTDGKRTYKYPGDMTRYNEGIDSYDSGKRKPNHTRMGKISGSEIGTSLSNSLLSLENIEEGTITDLNRDTESKLYCDINDVFLPHVPHVTVHTDHKTNCKSKDQDTSTPDGVCHKTSNVINIAENELGHGIRNFSITQESWMCHELSNLQLGCANTCANDESVKQINNNNIKQVNGYGQNRTPISAFWNKLLPGCKCSNCASVDLNSRVSSGEKYIDSTKGKRKFSVSHKLQIQINDHVTAKGDKVGYIRYIGHLDHASQPNMLYVGLELDFPVGSHDGSLYSKRYFTCDHKHGVFVPIQEIICKVGKKPSKSLHVKDEQGKLLFKKKKKIPDKSLQSA